MLRGMARGWLYHMFTNLDTLGSDLGQLMLGSKNVKLCFLIIELEVVHGHLSFQFLDTGPSLFTASPSDDLGLNAAYILECHQHLDVHGLHEI